MAQRRFPTAPQLDIIAGGIRLGAEKKGAVSSTLTVEYTRKTLVKGSLQAGRKEEAFKCQKKLENIGKRPFVPFPLRLRFFLKPGLRHFRSFKKRYSPPYLKALIYLGLNRPEEALAQLEKSSQARDYLLPVTLPMLKLYDALAVAEIAASPRYQALPAKIKHN